MNNLPCFILCRKNSKGLKNKNTKIFLKKPLIQHSIDYARKVKAITDIIVSTDDSKVAKIAKKNKCIVIFPRPKQFSDDRASSISALYHAAKYMLIKNYNFDIFAYLQVTEPLRPKNILSECIDILKKNKKINSSFAGYEVKKNFWYKTKSSYRMISPFKESFLPRQKRKPIFREDCGVALASRTKVLLNKKKLYTHPIKVVAYSGYEGLLDIHSKKDIFLGTSLKKII